MINSVIKCLLLISYVNCIPRVDPLVLIGQGLVRGQISDDGDYAMFLGVPYAQVDLNNPFGCALEPPNFGDEGFNAYDAYIQCPQPLKSNARNMTLDCLRLNIYVSNMANSRNPLPVLVWIHGGIFYSGSAGEQIPRKLVSHDIIVVTINYRLGPYGFMCLDTPLVTGNQGLKDQFAALRWIRNNIGAFGGNPYNVTIAGQSAGASSTLLHLYSDKEKLFHKVIVESGTPLAVDMFTEADLDAAKKLASYMGFNTSETEKALQFLAKSSPDSVIDAFQNSELKFRPCKERSFSGVELFLKDDPFSLANEKKIINTPILIGHNSNEYVDSLYKLGDNYFSTDPFYDNLNNNFNFEDETLNSLTNITRHFYIGDNPISTDVKSQLEKFESDFRFNYPIDTTITKLFTEKAKMVYEYVFSYVGDSGNDGAKHSAELRYLFDMNNEIRDISVHDELVSDRLTTLWSNFVKYGNPTPITTDLLPIIWEPVTKETRPYMEIDADLQLKHRVYNNRTAFWDLFHLAYGKNNRLIRECTI